MRPFFYSRPTTPLVLGATITSLPQRSRQVPDVAALSSPFRTPIIIDAINFAVTADSGDTTDLDYSGMVLCRFRMGNIELSPQDIPISLYTPSLQNYTAETLGAVYQENGHAPTTYARRWKLPVPLIVPAGNSLIPYFQRAPQAQGTTNVRVDISYSGRYLDASEPIPKRIQVPYVNAFYPVIEDWDSDALPLSYVSNEDQLANVHDQPVMVQRFLGRCYSMNNNQGGATELTPTDFNSSPITVEMRDSHGLETVKDANVFPNVFDYARRGWTFGKILEPKGRYTMTIRASAVNLVPMVSLMGWREVAV